MREKTAIFVAVRLNSKRLKNKAMLMLFDEPLIVKLTKRIMKSKLASDVIWCTSKLKSDDRLEIVAKKNSIKIFRHAPKDVMKRFIYAARKFKVKNIVRVTGDNPLTDPEVIDFMIKQHLKNGNDYTSCNSIPFGTRSEVISLKSLKNCHKMLQDPDSSEYMTWMMNRSSHFKVQEIAYPKRIVLRPEISLTVDYKKDYLNIKEIFEFFKGNIPSLEKLIKYIDTKPKLLKKLVKKRKQKKLKNINIKFKKKFDI